MRPECVSVPAVIEKLLPVIVSVASINGSSPCFTLPVYVPERSVCSCWFGSQRPLRGIAAGFDSAVALASVASAAGCGFGFDLWRRGFEVLAFAGAIVVDELEFCAETINPALVNAANTPITTTRTKG